MTATEQFFAAESTTAVITPHDDSRVSVAAGRHASASTTRRDEALPFASRLRVLVVGGAEPLGGMVAERLIGAGHRLAVHGVTIPAELPPSIEVDGEPYRAFEPIALAADRADAEDMVHTVARAEVALGGLDALVMLPAQHGSGAGLDADASTWADEWSLALTTEVLAAACAAHIAARSFLARRRAGRIVLVTNGLDDAQAGAMPAAATRAALSRLGVDLTRELSPHGIGVSVVATGTGGTRGFAVAQVADVVEALLSTPVLSGVSSQVG
jgi:NAD(P)-dependent dehydrogenase (short-subunit alcohol dehydrogenase family)